MGAFWMGSAASPSRRTAPTAPAVALMAGASPMPSTAGGISVAFPTPALPASAGKALQDQGFSGASQLSLVVMSARFSSTVFGPTPDTLARSSALLNGPFSVR